MGCITSRKKWPPDPRKRTVLRWEKRLVVENGVVVSKLVQVEDYVVDWSGLRCSGSSRSETEDG
jgi:hypothetical protein